MFLRFGNFIRKFLGLASAASEPANPEKVLEMYQEIFRKKMAHYNQSLAASAGLCELLKQQISEIECETCSSSTASDTQTPINNPELPGEFVRRRQAALNELADLQEQLNRAEASCVEIAQARDAAIQAARQQFSELKDCLSESRLQQALAELTNIPPHF